MRLLLIIISSSIISGLLTVFSMPPYSQAYLLFIALIPHLFCLQQLQKCKKAKRWLLWSFYLLIQLKITLLFTFSWMLEISVITLVLEYIILGVILLATLSWCVLFNKKRTVIIAFLIGFISYEWIIQNTEYTSSWLVLSPWLSVYPKIIQTYRYIGFGGGTLWILIVNLLIFFCLKTQPFSKRTVYILSTFVVLIVPISISLVLLHLEKNEKIGKTILLGNTKVRMYEEPYSSNYDEIIKYIDSHMEHSRASIDLALFPESISDHLNWFGNEENTPQIQTMKKWKEKNFIKQLVYGGIQYKLVEDEVLNPYIRFKDGYYYSTHNVAVSIDTTTIKIQAKEEFVPFQEYIPNRAIFESFAKWITQIGYQGLLSPLKESKEISSEFLTLICYEAVKPQLIKKRIKKQKFVVVISNEAWIKSEKYTKQTNVFLSSIAILINKPILKSSNHGVSIYIDKNGKMIRQFSDGHSRIIKL